MPINSHLSKSTALSPPLSGTGEEVYPVTDHHQGRMDDIKSITVSFIVLAYNDAPAIPELISKLQTVLDKTVKAFEIIVVDDGSSDDTAAVGEYFSDKMPSFKIVRHENNKGVGAAFRTGCSHCRYNIIGYMDGDAQYDPSDLPDMFSMLTRGDVVTGRRVKRADPWIRNITSCIYNESVKLLYGLSLKDINSGLKIYRRAYIEAAQPILSDGPFYDAEVLMKIKAVNGIILEMPIHHLPRKHGKAQGVSVKNIISTLVSIVDDRFIEYRKRNLLSISLIFFLTLLRKALQ